MPTVPLEFPVLVTPSKEGYQLRPLFLNSPIRTAKRFRDAMDLITKDVRQLFHDFKTERETSDQLLWFAFNPKFDFERQNFYFNSGSNLVWGDFAVVRFSLKAHQIICLPSFDNFFAILSKHDSFNRQIQTIIHDRLHERKKESSSFSPSDYYASDGEFITTLSLSVTVEQENFPFEQEIESLFASLNGQQDKFSGLVELARVGSNWHDNYPNKLQRAILREDYVTRLGQLIFGTTKTAMVIVGAPGSGRTTLLHETYFRYLQAQEGAVTTIWHIDPNRVIAGMSIVGQWQRRFESILEHVIQLPTHPCLFFDNLVALFRVGKSAQSSLTLSDVLKPYLEQRALTFIAEASPEEWNVVIETDRRFADLCQIFRLEEPSVADTAHIAIKKRALLEQKYECKIENEAIERIFSLRHSLLRGTAMPGNVVSFLERLAAKYHRDKVGVTQVEAAIGEMSQMTSHLLVRKKILVKKEVESALSAQLIGQEEAVHCLVNVVEIVKARLQDPKKPIASLLFIGPTGVGKTQAAKVLSHYLFTDEAQLIRLDMNEFVTDADVGRLIGNWGRPDGLLTTQIRLHPFCILLLDEIEKAHPAIHDLLLQVLGEGRLTDVLGRTTDFTNTIIILTSNLGSEQASHHVGFVKRDVHNQATSYRAAVEDFFRPELLNRIDRMVVFKSLALQDAIAISRLQMENLLQRDGFVRRTTILNISEKALMEVAQRGFDAVLGGRALKRAIERDLTILAATQLVKLQATQPILLDIDWINDHLQPHITALIPVQAEKDVNTLFKQSLTLENVSILLEFVTDLRIRLYTLRDSQKLELNTPSDEGRFLLTMQESVFDIKETLDEMLWAIETARDPTETRFIVGRQEARVHFSWSKNRYIGGSDLYPHQDIRDYLEEMYVLAPRLIKHSQSKYLNLFINAKFLGFFCRGLEMKQQEKLQLTLHSRVQGSGDKELNYLLLAYEKALSYLGIEATRITPTTPGFRYLHIKGPCLHTLLSGEEGIHLFHPPNENALPIQVSLNISITKPILNIIRDYVLPEENSHKSGVLSDLRTSLLNSSILGAHEWALLWYANLPVEEINF